MTTDSKAVCGGGEDPFSVGRIARLICEASGQNPDQCVHGSGIVTYGGDGKQAYAESKCYRRAWENYISPANAVIARYAALASTAGAGDWVTVPRTATKAMLDAAYTAHDAYEAAPEPKGWGGLGSVYKAMIEAAPAVPASPRSGEPLSQGGGEGRSEKGEGEDLDRLRYLAQSRYELLRECQSEFRALGCKGLVETIETALSHPLAKRAAPAQSPNTSDREG